MICKKCGRKNAPNKIRCEYCGALLPSANESEEFSDILNLMNNTPSDTATQNSFTEAATEREMREISEKIDYVFVTAHRNLVFTYIAIAVALFVLIVSTVLSVTAIKSIGKLESQINSTSGTEASIDTTIDDNSITLIPEDTTAYDTTTPDESIEDTTGEDEAETTEDEKKNNIPPVNTQSPVTTAPTPVIRPTPAQTTAAPVTTPAPAQTTTAPEHTTAALPEETTTVPEDATTLPEDTTEVPDDTTALPEETTGTPEDTLENPEETTGTPEDITTIPEEITSTPDDVIINPIDSDIVTDELTSSDNTDIFPEEGDTTEVQTDYILDETDFILDETGEI